MCSTQFPSRLQSRIPDNVSCVARVAEPLKELLPLLLAADVVADLQELLLRVAVGFARVQQRHPRGDLKKHIERVCDQNSLEYTKNTDTRRRYSSKPLHQFLIH